MDPEHFESQIERLKTQWRNSFGTERVSALWRMFKGERNDVFADAVSEIIVDQNAPPLSGDFQKHVQLAKNRIEHGRYYGLDGLDMLRPLKAAAKVTQADPEFVSRCMDAIKLKVTGKIAMREFEERCGLLEQAAKIYAKA